MKSIILLALLSLTAASAEGQCRPPHDSHEARLLAFYETPLVFSMAAAPARVEAAELALGVEVGNVPSPSAELQRPEFCASRTPRIRR